MSPDEVECSIGLVTKESVTLGEFICENRQTLPEVTVAYEKYGELNAAKDNVILVLHGITGSSHAAGKYDWSNRSLGYWDGFIGPGKVFDTDKYCVIAPNVLGGCRGTTGPSSVNPLTGKPYAMTFPIITVRDMVRVQEQFLREHFGVTELAVVTGGSMGGMQALEWAVIYPERVKNCIPIATSARVGARSIAFNECARRAILLDPKWQRGSYYDSEGGGPDSGLALARMIATITFLTDATMQDMFGRTRTDQESAFRHDLHARFDVERYLHDEGEKLVKRFDANSYLYLSRAIDLHDVSRGYPSLTDALARIQAKCLVIGISSDDLFPVRESHEMIERMQARGVDVTSFIVDSSYGHDAFLVEYRKMLPPLRAFMDGITGG
ncbi:homoserine O-acetyltransferase MetX [Armatimonas rosea]|uniref:Homoserine O-acetyltransferase n=1 Tax=Armatimonas rosea TaxID=685828 RepID=A0A7W9SVS9_ARMRO|nr:homoserine O-acetyltransferase [Armatimonas rosea]MBB6053767.1 homoserine O-acetyltransferase [Armatimonas rosea]